MSRVHMHLKRICDQDDKAEYQAITADFSETNEWEPVARIIIDKKAGRYEFYPMGFWEKEKLVPPMFYSLSEHEQKEIYERDYADCGYGAWTARIHRWTMQLIETADYPEAAPKVVSGP